MRIVRIIFVVLAVLAGAVACIICNSLGIGVKDLFNRKDITYLSTPYAMRTEYQQIIENATERVDLYITRKKNHEDDGVYKAIYSFDFRAGVDLKKHLPVVSNDTVYLPYPTITSVDQTDDETPLVLLERDGFNIKDIKAAKIAMENIAKDYAYRSDIVARSAELLKQYFQKMDTTHVYAFKGGVSEFGHLEEIIEIPNVGLYFSYFPELLNGSYRYEICDDIFSRSFITLVDIKTNKELFKISYWYSTEKDYDEIKKRYDNIDFLIIADPMNPVEKLSLFEYSTGDALVQFGNDVFLLDMLVDGQDAESKYYPDIIYLLSTIHKSEEFMFSENYRNWLYNYDRCIENINVHHFSSAKDNLTIMKTLCDKECKDVLYMKDLVNILGDYEPEYCTDNYPKFAAIVHGYYDIIYDGNIKDARQHRKNLLSWVSNDSYDSDSKQQLERYYLRNHKLEQVEISEYKRDLIQTGRGVDKQLIESLSKEEFLEFLKNSWYNIIRQHYKGNFPNQNIEACFPKKKIENHILLVKDLLNVEEDKYGSPEDIIEKLMKNGLKNDKYEPLFVVVFQQDHSVFNNRIFGNVTYDKDALVYKKDGVMYFANYDGVFDKDGVFVKYEDIKIKDENKGTIDMPYTKDKYDLHAPLACKLFMTFKDAYNNNMPTDVKERILKKLQNEAVSIAKDNIYYVIDSININMD